LLSFFLSYVYILELQYTYMKTLNYLIPIAIILVIAAGVVAFIKPTLNPEIPETNNERVMGPQDVTLTEGETKEATGLKITFHLLSQDYRCPVDAQCIEAGSVLADVTLQSGEQVITRSLPSDEVPYEFAGYKISIVKVTPDLLSGIEIRPAKYTVTFHVEPMAQGENI
jgi:hypothetical protein